MPNKTGLSLLDVFRKVLTIFLLSIRNKTFAVIIVFFVNALLPSSVNAKENHLVESLGVVNGNVTVRNSLVEISVFLSGKPLFESFDSNETLNSLVIENATLISQESDLINIQKKFNLPDGVEGKLNLAIQVQINGKPVKVTANEDSLGVNLFTPKVSDNLKIVPVGAAKFMIPVSYRGDMSVSLRVTENHNIKE